MYVVWFNGSCGIVAGPYFETIDEGVEEWLEEHPHVDGRYVEVYVCDGNPYDERNWKRVRPNY